MAHKLGLDCKLYYNEDGNENPIVPANWTELSNTRDVTLNLEKGEADVTTRANNGYRATATTLKDASVEFEMVWDPDDAGFTALRQAFFNNASIGILILDGAVTAAGSQGLVADMEVVNFSRNEPLQETVTVSVTLNPAYSDEPPRWVVLPES